LVDVSHLNDQGFWDVLEASRDPIVASHSNARSLCNHPRNLSDDMVAALAEKGGVVGVTFAPSFVSTGEATLEGVVDHIDRVAELKRLRRHPHHTPGVGGRIQVPSHNG